jgi:tetratricopeptide (TPR) repeat protein
MSAAAGLSLALAVLSMQSPPNGYAQDPGNPRKADGPVFVDAKIGTVSRQLLVAVAQSHGPRPLDLEDKPALLKPAAPRSDSDQDRIEALSMFSAARMLEKQQDYAGALRLYERAFRFDPDSLTVARAILPVADKLGRREEAIRYALKVVALDDVDPLLLRKLGAYLTEQGQWRQAVGLYAKSLAALTKTDTTLTGLLLEMEAGRVYHLTEQYPKAADCFARVLEALADPKKHGLEEESIKLVLGDPGPAYNLMGQCFLLAGRAKEAQAAMEKSNQLAPNPGLYALNLARLDQRGGRPREALDHLQACFDAHLASEGIQPYRLFGEVLESLKLGGELLPRLEKLHAADPANVPLAYYLADRYLDRKQFDKAEPLYRALVAKTPSGVGLRSLAAIYRQTKKPEALLEVLGELTEKSAAVDALGGEGRALDSDTAMVGALLDTAQKKLKSDEAKFPYAQRLAAALLALDAKRYDDAGALFEAAIRAKPDRKPEVLLAWGVGLLAAEQNAAAGKVLRRGIEEKALPADNPSFEYYLAGSLELEGKTDEALAVARAALAKKDDSPRFLSRVAWIQYHARRYDEARKTYQELIDRFDAESDEDDDRETLREARLALSNLDVEAGKLREGEEWLQQVLDEFPDDVAAMNDLGYLWADSGKRLNRALAMVQKAVDAEPDNSAYRDSLGWALYRLGRLPEAMVQLEKAAVLEADPAVLEHLGDVYASAQQPAKAKDAWQRAAAAYRKAKPPQDGKAQAAEKKIQKNP